MNPKLPFFLFVTVPLLLISIFSLFFIAPIDAYSTEYVYPLEDAKVWKYSSSTNYGDDPISSLGNMSQWLSGDESIGFWKFNFSTFDVSLDSGEELQYGDMFFELYVHSYYDFRIADNFFTLGYSENKSWLEQDITWDDQPSFTETDTDIEVTVEDQYVSWDLRDISNDIIYAIENDDNFTLVITYNDFITQGFSARMKEYGGISFDPRVQIRYDIVTPEDAIYEREINLRNFPLVLGDALHIGDLGGQLLSSVIIACMFLLPTFYASKDLKDSTLPIILMGLLVYALLVAISYLPVWTFLVLAMLIAMLYANKLKGWFGKNE